MYLPRPAGQTFFDALTGRTVSDAMDRLRAPQPGDGSGLLGVALPVSPQVFTVFDSMADPTLASMGLTCAQVRDMNDNDLRGRVRDSYINAGMPASRVDVDEVRAKIGRLIARLRYECAVLLVIDGIGQRAQRAEASLRDAQTRASSLASDNNNLKAQAISLNQQIATLRQQLATANQQLAAARSGSAPPPAQKSAVVPVTLGLGAVIAAFSLLK